MKGFQLDDGRKTELMYSTYVGGEEEEEEEKEKRARKFGVYIVCTYRGIRRL